MFFIFGFGRKMVKRFGRLGGEKCQRCNNITQKELIKITTWFTLFFIPIIPYKTQYVIGCPICGNSAEVGKDAFNHIIDSGQASEGDLFADDKYAGKTPTQIAYLKQMEEIERERSNAN